MSMRVVEMCWDEALQVIAQADPRYSGGVSRAVARESWAPRRFVYRTQIGPTLIDYDESVFNEPFSPTEDDLAATDWFDVTGQCPAWEQAYADSVAHLAVPMGGKL